MQHHCNSSGSAVLRPVLLLLLQGIISNLAPELNLLLAVLVSHQFN